MDRNNLILYSFYKISNVKNTEENSKNIMTFQKKYENIILPSIKYIGQLAELLFARVIPYDLQSPPPPLRINSWKLVKLQTV